MAGLLSDVLPFVYSQGDRAKRYLTGLLADPVGTLQQTAGGIVDAGRAQQGLLSRAFADPNKPFLPTDREALAQAAGNVLAGPLSFAPVGMFAGVGAKTANRGALMKAQDMEAAGIDPAQIWRETGWGKAPDGRWRFELNDSNSMPLPRTWGEGKDLEQGMSTVTRRQRALAHPELSAAYPETKDIGVNLRPGTSKNASYSEDEFFGPQIQAFANPAYGFKPDRSSILHELQHAVQSKENFARGGNTEMFNQGKDAQLARDALSFRREVDALGMPKDTDWIAKENAVVQRYHDIGAPDWLPSPEARALAADKFNNPDAQLQELVNLYGLDKSVTPANPRDLYQRLAGEAEARLVQQRMDMSPAARTAQFPWEPAYFQQATGVPLDSLIFHDGTTGKLKLQPY